MKTLVFGDIHGRTCWKDIIEREKPDRVVFLGDYVSTHEDITAEQQIENMNAILRLKEQRIEGVDPEVILLRVHIFQRLRIGCARIKTAS